MRQLFANSTLQDHFLASGYVRVPMLSAEEVSYLSSEIGKLRPDDNFNPQPQPDQKYRPSYHCSFLDKNVDYKRKAFDLIQEVFDPHLKRYMPNFEIISANFYVKPPHTGVFTIHQNWPVLDLDDTTVTLWCPLQNVDVHNGGIHVVPGSHKILPHVQGVLCPPYFKDFQEALIEKYLQPIPMLAGDGLIFDDGLIHWSPVNNSEEARIAVQILCVPSDATPILYFFDLNHPEQFEKIEASKEFFISQSITDMTVRQRHWKSLGFVENKNRYISEQEFIELLKKGDEIRKEIYFPNTISNSPAMHPETSVSLVDNNKKMTQKPEKVPPVLTRIISRCKNLLGMKPQSAKTLSVPQISGVMRDARAPINQHTISDVTDYYNEWTQRYIEGFGEVFQGSRPDSTDELFDYIIDAAKLEDGMTVLDAGCGVCGPAIGLSERRNLTIEAVTLSKVQVAEGQQRIKDRGLQNRITVRQGDFHRLAEIYPPAHFDRILFLESLCHAEDYRMVLQQAKQVLKPGGFIYIKDFYAVDHRSRPNLLELEAEDLRELNRIYCLIMPDLPSTVDIISELGFHIFYMRQPLYTYSPAIWENFMRHTNVFWVPKLGNPDRVIRAIEFFAYNTISAD